MADAAVTRARHEESFELPEEAVRAVSVPTVPRRSWLLAFLWVVLTALLTGFLFFGSVRIGAGNWTGRRMRITQIWPSFLSFLEEQGASAPIISFVVLMLAVTLIGGAGLVWLALRMQDQHADTLPEQPADS